MIEHFCDWLNATPLSTAFQTWTWFVPVVQIVHIISVSVIFMAVLRIGVRLLGPDRNFGGLSEFLDKLVPAIWTAMIILLISGTLLTITEPARELLNWVFRTKMVMVLLLAGMMIALRQIARRDSKFGRTPSSRVVARTAGVLSMVLGVAIITAFYEVFTTMASGALVAAVVFAEREMSLPLPTLFAPLSWMCRGWGVELAFTSFRYRVPSLDLQVTE